MRVTDFQAFIILLCVTAGTVITRFLPFLLFPENKERPKLISYLSVTVPAAMMGLLIIYCLKSVSLTADPYGLPEIIAVAVTALIHLLRKNVLLSIAVGTLLYMFLVQAVF